MMTSLRLAAFAAMFMLCGCATIIDGSNQEVAVNSNPEGAKCELSRKGEIIGRVETPQTIVVKKTKHDIMVTCRLEGFHQSREFLKSKIEDATWGNIVAGGVIGWGIDSATGADNKYEKYVTITMVPLNQSPPPPPTPPSSDQAVTKPEDTQQAAPVAETSTDDGKTEVAKPRSPAATD